MNNTTTLNLGDLLLAFRRKIIEEMRKDGFNEELTFSQMEAVRFLRLHEKHTMKSIAKKLGIAPPSATAIIKELERKKLVTRQSDKTDRRIVYITLSEKTKRTLDIAMKRKEAVMNRFVSKLDAKDKLALERIINILLNKNEK